MYRRPIASAVLFILFAYLFAPAMMAQKERIKPACPMNIIIAIDFSGSEREYLDEIRTALLALTAPFELHETQLKIGIITFNRGAELVLPLTGDTGRMEEAVESLRIVRMVYATDIHAAIDLANREFRENGRPGIPKYFILISDGDPHAHRRGFGFQADLRNIERLKMGDPEQDADPVHVFTLYTGRLSADPYDYYRFTEETMKAAINHMRTMASGEDSFFYYEQYPSLVEIFERIGSCL